MMNVLLTGGAGYLGSCVLTKLILRGHKVRILDIGYFGVGHLRALRPTVELVRDDIRKANTDSRFVDRILDRCDCIVHLAALSNDPSADLDPNLTEEVNALTTHSLAQAAKERGIRFIFSSSCSIYGGTDGEVTEGSHVEPLTTYAKSKVKAERALETLVNSHWQPVILRNGTLFGYSPRMRFDLVVNIFSLFSVLYNEIKVFGSGEHWRPFLHVDDCARALVFFVERERCRYLHYNLSHENLRVLDVAEIFKGLIPSLKVTRVQATSEDQRNYRVSTQRLCEEGFQTRIGVEMGANGIQEAIVNGLIADPESIYYQNAKWLKELNPNLDPRAIMKKVA